MIQIDLAGLQSIVNGFMQTPITISHFQTAPAQDPSNRTGDNVVTFSGTTDTMAWFVDVGTKVFSGGTMVSVTDRPILRVPVGTDIKAHDEVLLGGEWWTVLDASTDETWPVMVKVGLVRIE
jgi:hypothetical protein